MRLLHYLEIENFKRFGDKQRIELDHPAVLIGPNNCGKTTAIQAIALWSQAVKTWYDNKGKAPPKERKATSINRLKVVSVPVQRTRYFWHNASVRKGNHAIWLEITLGILHNKKVEPVTMRFRNQGEDLVYCTPDDQTLKNPDLIKTAAQLNVNLLYPMSGLESEEPVLQPGRIDVLLGQGQTAQVLRNLCLLVYNKRPNDWERIVQLMDRLFKVRLDKPKETVRGSIQLSYQQTNVKEHLDIALAGRGFQQMLLVFAYLYSHRGSVLLIDEPDAHLEILRQKQIYVLLRDIASENESQVILVTHSEIILDESLDHNLTLLLGGKADDLAQKTTIRSALKNYGAEHYVRAMQRGYVLYLEGSTDLSILREMARHLDHNVKNIWDERTNVYYVQDTFPEQNLDSELERVEGGFGVAPVEHFFKLREMAPRLKGLAILDSDGRAIKGSDKDGFQIEYWKRYEVENYFITPGVLRAYAEREYSGTLWQTPWQKHIDEILDQVIIEYIFDSNKKDFHVWKNSDQNASKLIWEAQTRQRKISVFAEEFFRRLANRLGHTMVLRKGEFHRLIQFTDPQLISDEVSEKLDLLAKLFTEADPIEEL